jgi:hypothetical protein
MSRQIGFALLLIALISSIVWMISQYIQPILPYEINGGLVLAFVSIIGTVGFLASFKDTLELMQFWQEHKDRQLLNAKFGRGPYDKATIERSTRNYVRPKCSNLDPAQEKEIRHALVATRKIFSIK